MKPGIKLLSDIEGDGPPIERQHTYLIVLKLWLNRGEPVRWKIPWGLVDRARLEDDGATLVSDLRVDRQQLFPGLFYGIQGMKIGGVRRLKIASHLAYGAKGVPGVIPEQAALVAEIRIMEERCF